MRSSLSALTLGFTWFAVSAANNVSMAHAAASGAPIRLARSIDGRRFADLGVVIFPSGDSPDLELSPDGDLVALARVESVGASKPSSNWVVSKSADRGRTWSGARPIVVQVEPGQPIEVVQAGLVRTPGGRVRLFGVSTPKSGTPSGGAQRGGGDERRGRTRRGGDASDGDAIENPRVFVAESKDGISFRARRRPVWEFDGSGSPRITSALFSGRIHLYADAGESASRRRLGDRRLDHRVSRDGRRFVSVQPTKIPDDVAIGSIVEARDGPRMYVSVGDAVRSFASKDGREWREERGVRMSGARSPAVVRLSDDTYLMAFVAARGDRNDSPSSETVASANVANPSAAPIAEQPTADGSALVVLPTDADAADEEPSGEADEPEVDSSEPTAEEIEASRVADVRGYPMELTEAQSQEILDELRKVVRGADDDDDEEVAADNDDADDYGFAPRPDEKPDVDYIEWFRTQAPTAGADNAASEYEEIANDPRLKKPEEGETPVFVDMFNSDHSGPPVPWDASDHPEWAESSTRVQDLIEKFHRASIRSNFAPPLRFDESAHKDRKPLLIDMLLPDFSSHRTLAKATLADAWKKQDGQVSPERMMNAWRTVLRGANHFEKRPTLIENLVSIAERRLVMENARWALKQDVLSSEEQLQEALEILRSLGRDNYDTGVAARGEFAMAAQFTQYVFSPPGPDGKPRLNPQHVDELTPYFEDWPEFDADMHDRLLAMTVQDYYATLDAFERVYREMADQLRVSYPDVRAADMDAMQMGYLHSSPLVELLMPSLSRVMVLRARNETTFRATQLVYAVHLFRAEQGRWPRTLDELPRKTSTEIRIDPFSGKDFGYRLETQGPVIYSFSENAEDDGGVHSPRWGDGEKDENASDDFVFWPPQGAP